MQESVSNLIACASVPTHRVRKFNYEYIVMVILGLCSLLYGKNPYIDLLFIAALSFALFFCRKEYLYIIYFLLFFFMEIFVFPNVLFLSRSMGSLFRVYQMIFLIRFVFDINHIKLNKRYNLWMIFFLLYFTVYTVIWFQSTISLVQIALLINFFIICEMQRYVMSADDEKFDTILQSIGIFAAFASIYGILNPVSELGYVGGAAVMGRSSGTFEPNFMAMFCNMGLVALICSDFKRNRIIKIIAMLFCVYSLLSTVSMSGIICFVGAMLLFSLLKRKVKYFIYFCIGAALVGVVIYFLNRELFDFIFMRFAEKIDYVQEGAMADATTGRSDLQNSYLKYFFGLGLLQQLFGASRAGGLRFLVGTVADNLSHSTYIDSLLKYGLIGFLLIWGRTAYSLISRVINLNKDNKNIAIICLKAVMLVSFLGLSCDDRIMLLFAFI